MVRSEMYVQGECCQLDHNIVQHLLLLLKHYF